HARHPSGEQIDSHGHDHGQSASSQGGASIKADASVVHAAHDEPMRHDQHGHADHVVEPAAAGSRPAELFTTGLLLISAALSWVALVDVGFLHHDARIVLFPWITSGDLQVPWSLRIDTLTAVMLVVVN